MLSIHLGASVAPHADGHIEVGWFGLKPTEAGRKLIAWPDCVHQFHREGFALAAGATLLAEGESRDLPQPGLLLWRGGLRHPVPHRADHGDGRPLDRPYRRPGEAARRSGGSDSISRDARLHDWKTRAFLDGFLDLWLKRDQRQPAAMNASGGVGFPSQSANFLAFCDARPVTRPLTRSINCDSTWRRPPALVGRRLASPLPREAAR